MRTVIYAAIAAEAVTGIRPATADDGDIIANPQFTPRPSVITQVSLPSVPSVAMVQNGQSAAAYGSQTNPGVWLLPP